MIVKPISDVHTEDHSDRGVRFFEKLDITLDDTLLMLGDITPFCRTEEYERYIADVSRRVKRVLMVTGNHEYYKSYKYPKYSAEEANFFMKEIVSKYPNVKLLDNEIVEIDGQRFIGGTMWYNERRRFDGKRVHVDDIDIVGLEPWVFFQHAGFIDLIKRELRPGDIVLTHHAPSSRSSEEKYKHSAMQSCFVHPLDDLIMERKPKFWFHGHLHCSSGYYLGETYVVCNPYGYESFAVNMRFDRGLKFEI